MFRIADHVQAIEVPTGCYVVAHIGQHHDVLEERKEGVD